jgi:hypothetical protein
MPLAGIERPRGGNPVPNESFIVGEDFGRTAAEAGPHFGEGQRLGIDALHHRKQIPPTGLGRLGVGDPSVLENAPEDERTIGGAVAAIPYGAVCSRFSQCTIDGATRIVSQLRRETAEITPARHSVRDGGGAMDHDSRLTKEA